MKAGVKGIELLLKTDIEALEEIVGMVFDCLVALGSPASCEEVLRSVDGAIEDSRWREAMLSLRVDYHWRICDDSTAAWTCLSMAPEFAATTRPWVLMAWLATAPGELPLTQRLAVIARIRRCHVESDMLIHIELLEAAYRYIDSEDEDALEILRRGIARYRAIPEADHSAYGVWKLFQSMAFMSAATRDASLLDEGLAVAQRFLVMSREFPADSSRNQLLCECGEACLMLKSPSRGVAFLESALIEDPDNALAMVFLARARLWQHDVGEARRWLASAEPRLVSKENRVDYAYVAAELALASGAGGDIEYARNQLVSCGPLIGIFERRRLDYLDRLATKPTPVLSTSEPSFWENLATRYLMIEPNVAGIGLRLNEVIADAIAAHKSKEQ